MRLFSPPLPNFKRIFFLLFFFTSFLFLNAQSKTAPAVRVTTSPNIDGVINESVWQNAIPIKEFTQQEPIAGAQPSHQIYNSQLSVIKLAHQTDFLNEYFLAKRPSVTQVF